MGGGGVTWRRGAELARPGGWRKEPKGKGEAEERRKKPKAVEAVGLG
jgi:hypothetical protein